MSKFSNRKACECGILYETAKDKFMPLERKRGDKFILFLSSGKEEYIHFCFFCGGYKLGPLTKKTYKCKCKILEKWSRNLAYPVKFDKKFEEYYLEGKDTSTHIFYFCPLCGGRLVESKRGDFFLTPSESEVNEIHKKIKNAQTVDEIIKILGFPDEKMVTDSEEVKKQKSLGRTSLRQTLIYNSIANSFSLIVIEDEDEKIHFLSAGKPKKAD